LRYEKFQFSVLEYILKTFNLKFVGNTNKSRNHGLYKQYDAKENCIVPITPLNAKVKAGNFRCLAHTIKSLVASYVLQCDILNKN